MHTFIGGLGSLMQIVILLWPIPVILLIVFLPRWARGFLAVAVYTVYLFRTLPMFL